MVGVSGMGVGGVNAHLVVQDRVPGPYPRRPPATPEVRLVAWSAWLLGAPGPAAIHRWLATGGNPPEHGFGDRYPPPPFTATRLPPVVTEVIDRGHLMALDVAHRFVGEHGELWQDLRGPTMSFDTGTTSTLTAIHAALRYLRQERLDLALVLAFNESRTPEAADLTGHEQARLAEGAFLLDHIGDEHHHVRIFADVRRPIRRWCDPNPALDRLLELALLACQRCGDRLARGSVAVTVLDPLTDFQVHPDSAALTGFARGLGCERSPRHGCVPWSPTRPWTAHSPSSPASPARPGTPRSRTTTAGSATPS